MTDSSRLTTVIFALLLGILGVLSFLLLAGAPEGAVGGPHPIFEGMSSGGDGVARLGGQGGVLALLQVLILLLIHALIALGIAPRHRNGRFWFLLSCAAAASLAIWLSLYFSYRDFSETGEGAYVLGFPLPTTLMLFGVFLGGSLLCALYIWGFRRFVYTEEDEAAYEALRREAPVPRVPSGGVDR